MARNKIEKPQLHKGKNLLLAIFCLGSFFGVSAQTGRPPRAIISIENSYLIAKMDNPMRIVAQQTEPVSLRQLSATFQVYDGQKVPIEITERKGYFTIRPDSIGMVEIHIAVGDTTEIRTLRVKPMPAVGRLGRFCGNTGEKIDVGEFKAQMGLTANIEYGDICGSCQILGYQVLRVSSRNEVEKALNRGARFGQHTQAIIMKAEPGDVFIFREIRYKCPGAASPQRLEDMVFEVE